MFEMGWESKTQTMGICWGTLICSCRYWQWFGKWICGGGDGRCGGSSGDDTGGGDGGDGVIINNNNNNT